MTQPPLKKSRHNSSNNTITILSNSAGTTSSSTSSSNSSSHQQQHSSQANQQQTFSENHNIYAPVFFNEISDIMRAFGDCDKPLRDSVILVEKIVLQQLRSILQDVVELATTRIGTPNPSRIDFEYLMRKNPIKIIRLQRHISDMKFRRIYQDRLALLAGRTTNLNENGDTNVDDVDESENLPMKYDEEKVRRLYRADKISQSLDREEYKKYECARRTSFLGSNSFTLRDKLRCWLNVPDDIRISLNVYMILSYLAHETIATIVDYSILTRLNSDNRKTDPFCSTTPSGINIKIYFSRIIKR